MALSANAAKTLEQVKMGLLKLYGADYFTEDEFIKIDCLIHKGKYVFTNGPPTHYEEELMSFEDSPIEMKPINVQTSSIESFEPSKTDIIAVSEEQVLPSLSSSEDTGSHFQIEETPNATSAEASSDEETAPPTTSPAEVAPILDFSESTATSIKPSEQNPQPQISNSLPPGITQKQLDEARAMQAGMTKAGKKGRPKYERHDEPNSETAWVEDLPSEPRKVKEVYPSPAPSERDSRISDWASEVNAQQLSTRKISSPMPTKVPDPVALIDQFVKIHGRKPKTLNDIYQPKNPAHYSNRPGSVISATTTETAKTTKTTKAEPKKGLVLGSTYVAQRSQFKSSHILIDIKAGDPIQVNKFVSGIQWVGKNMRTQSYGQFSEDVFKPSLAPEESKPPKHTKTDSVAPSVTSSAIRNGLENVEGMNAAEWDEVPLNSRPRSATPAPTPVRPALGGGLGSSRFAALAEKEESKSPAQLKKQEITPEMEKEFGKLVSEKVDEILKARGMAATPALAPTPVPAPNRPSRSRTLNEPLKAVPPKANPCWFWATGKGCRFTAEECRDLHSHTPSATGEATNLHMGKPTWAAVADSAPAVSHADSALFSVPEVAAFSADAKASGQKILTCWYWANNDKCNFTAENCKYAHAHMAKGVASRPGQKFGAWSIQNWKRKEDGGETVDGEGSVAGWAEQSQNGGEMVLEEVTGDDSASIAAWGVISDGGAGGWGRDTRIGESSSTLGRDDRYKPPHVKILEEKARIEAVGW